MLYQQGSARIRFPDVQTEALQAVLINTAGGLTGDDNINWHMLAGANSSLTLSTAACEKIYRTHGPDANQNTTLEVEQGARLNWLPQESILFNGSALKRSLQVNMESSATAMLLESLVFGRQAMSESMQKCRVHDRWRIYQNDELLHAEDFRFDQEMISTAQQACIMHRYSAYSTLVFVSPQLPEWQSMMVERVRQLAALQLSEAKSGTQEIQVGASSLRSRVVVRVLASNSFHLRRFLIPCVQMFCDDDPVPAVWNV